MIIRQGEWQDLIIPIAGSAIAGGSNSAQFNELAGKTADERQMTRGWPARGPRLAPGPAPKSAHRFTSTSATRLTPLHAITRFPSGVAIMWRTTPPPDGITQVWNFSVLGSKRTNVFGLTADSLYQMTSSDAVMPYGCDCGPPGDGHSLTAPVFGSSRPR